MKIFMKHFLRDDSGAVSVEWVVLVAAVIGLCVAVFGAMDTGTMDLADDTSDFVSTYDPLL